MGSSGPKTMKAIYLLLIHWWKNRNPLLHQIWTLWAGILEPVIFDISRLRSTANALSELAELKPLFALALH